MVSFETEVFYPSVKVCHLKHYTGKGTVGRSRREEPTVCGNWERFSRGNMIGLGSVGEKKILGLFAMGLELQVERCSRNTLDWKQEAWVLDLARPTIQRLTLGESFPLPNVSFLICKVISGFFLDRQKSTNMWNWMMQNCSYGSGGRDWGH